MSGTHCTGKSTLIDAFLKIHSDYAHEPEPYEWLEVHGESFADEPDAEMFYRQLEVSVESLARHGRGARVIFERSPVDFLAYLLALQDLGRTGRDCELTTSSVELAATGLQHLDLLVVLPLSASNTHLVSTLEDVELRSATNDRLIEMITTDPYSLFHSGAPRIIEMNAGSEQGASTLQRLIDAAE